MTRRSTSSRGARRSAFSLIEILIVAVIVGILAALLLPAISTVRWQAKSTACMGNLRQVGMATDAYLSDNHGMMYGATGTVIGGRTYNWLGIVGCLYSDTGWTDTSTLPPKMRCMENVRGSYTYAINHNVTIKLGRRGRSAMLKPESTLLAMDGGWEYNSATDVFNYLPTFSPNRWRNFYKYNHGSPHRDLNQLDGRLNALYVDGHVSGFHKGDKVITTPHETCRALNPWWPDDYCFGSPGTGGATVP